MYLIFDTETNGLPKAYGARIHDVDNWPRMLQLAWQVHAEDGKMIKKENFLIKPDGFELDPSACEIHGLTLEILNGGGSEIKDVLKKFAEDLKLAQKLVGHNISFDHAIVGSEIIRTGMEQGYLEVKGKERICTMHSSTKFCKIPSGRGGLKWPKLQELYKTLFGENFEDAHDAGADVEATAKCFFELKKLNVITL